MEQIYRISFFKKLMDSYGRPVDACQGTIEIRGKNPQRAIADARVRFAELTGVSDWSSRADYETVEVLPGRKRISPSAWTKSRAHTPHAITD